MSKKILYIEDNPDTASAVKVMLEGEGYKAQFASTGKEGLKKAKSGFDLILLDIMLPDMSGWDIFEKLRNMKETKFAFLSVIPVSSERLSELKGAGISDYITKPFTKEELIKRVKTILK